MANPTFQEQLAALIQSRVPAEKLAEAQEQAKPIFEAMTRTFQGYATDIDDAKTRLRALEGIKPEDHKRLEDNVQQLTEENTALKAQVADFKTKYETSDKELIKAKGELSATNREKEVRKAMGAFKIAPDSVEEVYDIIASRVLQKPDGSFYIPHTVKSKDAAGSEITTEMQSPITDYMTKHWAVTPFAKRVLLADYSSGGGAAGSGKIGGGGSKPWKDMSLKEQTKLYLDNPTLAKQLQEAASAEE